MLQLLRWMMLLSLISIACEDATKSADVVRMYRAHAVHEAPGSRERARHKLGCDPCESFFEENEDGFEENEDGDLIEFLYNDEAPMTLAEADIDSVSIGKVSRPEESPYLLVVHLTDAGIERIAEYRGSAETVLTVNEIDGEIVGMMPLWVSGRTFMVGSFADLDHAKRVAAKLGAPIRIVIEPTI